MHIDKSVWGSLTPAQRAAIERAAKDSVVESYKAADSVECVKLSAMLEINKRIKQRNVDGSPRLVNDKPASAVMTLATWPDETLAVLLDATNDYLTSLAGPVNEKTAAQKDFSAIHSALTTYAESIHATRFNPGTFPGKSGLAVGEECRLVK